MLQINGRDRHVPLIERKERLRDIMPAIESRALFLDVVAERGRDLFRVACERDLEGIVGKWSHGPYQLDGRATSWLKIKNRDYSPMLDRHELFERRRSRALRGRPIPPRPELILR